jgi:hypothetical protein
MTVYCPTQMETANDDVRHTRQKKTKRNVKFNEQVAHFARPTHWFNPGIHALQRIAAQRIFQLSDV